MSCREARLEGWSFPHFEALPPSPVNPRTSAGSGLMGTPLTPFAPLLRCVATLNLSNVAIDYWLERTHSSFKSNVNFRSPFYYLWCADDMVLLSSLLDSLLGSISTLGEEASPLGLLKPPLHLHPHQHQPTRGDRWIFLPWITTLQRLQIRIRKTHTPSRSFESCESWCLPVAGCLPPVLSTGHSRNSWFHLVANEIV